jgi:hypothetical protein
VLYDAFRDPGARNAPALYLGIVVFACFIVAFHHIGAGAAAQPAPARRPKPG